MAYFTDSMADEFRKAIEDVLKTSETKSKDQETSNRAKGKRKTTKPSNHEKARLGKKTRSESIQRGDRPAK
jgi:hypothetical protein